MSATPPITKEEREEVVRCRMIPKRFILNNHESVVTILFDVIEAYEAALTASEAEVERMREALRQIAEAHHMMIEPDLKAIARAALTGETK